MKGKYLGFYKYNNERVHNKLGRSQTFFDLEITGIEGDNFWGTVEDEPIGQPGTGTITGVLKGGNISFIKQMSVAASITADGSLKTYNSKHPKIYYNGIYTDGKYKGTWKIKFGFIFSGLIPIPIPPISGIWEMRLK